MGPNKKLFIYEKIVFFEPNFQSPIPIETNGIDSIWRASFSMRLHTGFQLGIFWCHSYQVDVLKIIIILIAVISVCAKDNLIGYAKYKINR